MPADTTSFTYLSKDDIKRAQDAAFTALELIFADQEIGIYNFSSNGFILKSTLITIAEPSRRTEIFDEIEKAGNDIATFEIPGKLDFLIVLF